MSKPITKFYAGILGHPIISKVTYERRPVGPRGMYRVLEAEGRYSNLPPQMIGTHVTLDIFDGHTFDKYDDAKKHLVDLLKAEREKLRRSANILSATIHVLTDEEDE